MGQYADNDPAAFEAMSSVMLIIHPFDFYGNFFSFHNWIIQICICRKCNWSCSCSSKQMDRFYLFNIFSLSLLSLCSQLNSNLLLVILTIIRKSADNIFTLQQWCSNNFPQAKEELEQMYKDVCFLIFPLCAYAQASSLCLFTLFSFFFFFFFNHGCTGV